MSDVTTLSIFPEDADKYSQLREIYNERLRKKHQTPQARFKGLNQKEFFSECIIMIEKQMKVRLDLINATDK